MEYELGKKLYMIESLLVELVEDKRAREEREAESRSAGASKKA